MEKNDSEKRRANLSGGDSSLNSSSGVLPSKRARIEFTPSRSSAGSVLPMSPIFEDDSPTKLFPLPKDKIETTMDLSHVPLLEEDDENQNSDMVTKSTSTRSDDGGTTHFELPSPLNTAEEPDFAKKDDQDNGAESDSDSDKFFANIKAREMKEEQDAAATRPNETGRESPRKTSNTGYLTLTSSTSGSLSGHSGGLPVAKRVEHPFYAPTSEGKVVTMTDSKFTSTSPNETEYLSPPKINQVELDLKVYDPRTGKLLFDSACLGSRLRCEHVIVTSFLRQVGVDLESTSLSGYSADISSSLDSEASVEFSRRKQLSMASTISSIPRPSDASTISRPSYIGAKDAFVRPAEPRQGIRGGKMSPYLNSTRIDDQETQSVAVDRTTQSNLLNENVLDINSNTNSAQKRTEIVPNGDSSSASIDEKELFVTPTSKNKSSRKANKTPQTTSDSTLISDSDFDNQSSRFETPKGKWKSSNGSSITPSSDALTLSSSGSTSSKRKGREAQSDASPLTDAAKKAIEEFDDNSFGKSANLWGSISRGDIVFARWRDKKYYSGIISDKGANDTWKIKFDDNMDDVASETHILPIKLLGYGVRAVYCPPEIYNPAEVFLVGLRKNPDANSKTTGIKSDDIHAHIQYAAVTMDGEVIYCYRNNLTLNENDAKDLRREFSHPSQVKIGEIGIENIVEDTRRRRCGESLAPSDKIRKIIKLEQSGFDTSASDELLREISTPTGKTPTPKKGTGKKGPKTPKSAGGSKNNTPRRPKTTTESSAADSDPPSTKSLFDTPIISKTSTASTNTPKTTPIVATPKTSGKDAAVSATKEPKPKKVKEKKLFEGVQFFMTASGGAAADPSGRGPVVIPYDKDECRDSIENNGGRIIDKVGNESKNSKHPIYLISDSFARTVKFIYSVGCGIPCLSYKWIEECCKLNTMVDWKPFQLDAGWSLEEDRIIPAHTKTPLKDLKVSIIAESLDLYNYWKPVLVAAQASLLKSYAKGPIIPAQTEVLVTDSTCPENVIAHAKKKNIPLVKPEWLVQTIIRGKKSPYAGHEKYRFENDYDDEELE